MSSNIDNSNEVFDQINKKMKYGAPELKKLYQKFVTRGLIMAVNVPPHNDDAEKSVLGAALQKDDALADVMEVINADDFYRDQHKEIFRAMTVLNGAGIAVDTNPRPGDVAVSNSGYYGHVMYVESVNPNGTINISQYNWSLNGTYSEAYNLPKAGLVFIHF